MKKNKFEGYRKLSLRELQLLQLETMKEIHKVCVKENINYYIIGGTLLGAIRHKGFIPWDDDIDIAMMRADFDNFKKVFNQNFNNSDLFLQCYDTDKDFRPAMLRVCIKNTIQDLKSEAHLKNCKNTYIDIFPLDNVPNSDGERQSHSKELKRIDRLIELKLYHIYEQNSIYMIFFKKLVSSFLSIIPLKLLQNNRVRSMTRYNNQHTKCVASTVSRYGYIKQVMCREMYGTPQLYEFENTQFYGPEQFDDYLRHLFGDNYMEIPPVETRVCPTNVYIKD